MEISTINPTTSKLFGRMSFVIRKYSPEILTGVGVIGVVAAGVLAARATLKLEKVVDKGKERLEEVGKLREETNEEGSPLYSEQELVQKKVTAYTINVMDVVKLYGPSVSLGVASIGSIIAAHGIMRRRNVAILAAYKVLETSYANYRARVIEEFGEEKDRDFHLGIREEEITNDEGKKVKVKAASDPNQHSSYARFFDEGNPDFQKSADLNLYWLKAKQNYWNDVLRSRGFVFLNEVYSDLGFEHSRAGQVVGWMLSNEGDNYIDFGMYEVQNSRFINGDERSILLDFNVDGVIIDKLNDR